MLIFNIFYQFKSKLFLLVGFVLLFTSMVSNSAPYVPPIGTPAPEFGINEAHTMYADSEYDFGNGPEAYKDAGYGPYTHYIDNSVACTDSGNEFGTQSNPRCNLPSLSGLAPGSVVEIHGGEYISRNWMTSSGTADKPIFIRGYVNPNWVIQNDENGNPIFVKTSDESMPVIASTLRIRGAYILVENIDFNIRALRNNAIDIRPANSTESVHHVSIRNNEVRNFGHIWAGGRGALMTATGFDAELDSEDTIVNDIVYYKNNVHADNNYTGFDGDGNAVAPYQDDVMGISIAARSNRVWIVDNHVHHTSGDALGTGHAANYTSTNYYIGRNILNDCDENAVDLKEVEHYVVSQNIMYNFYGAGLGSNGTITVVHYGPSLWPKNTWFIYNEMYNAADNAVQVGGKVLDDVYYIGNVIHSISNASQTGTAFRSWGSRNINIVGNTVYGTDRGVVSSGGSGGREGTMVIENNIFSQLSTEGYVRLSDSGDYAARAVIKNNLFYSDAFTPVIDGDSINELDTDPRFIDPSKHRFQLQNAPAPSPAINSGSEFESDVYKIFQDRFGRDIRKDFNGLARPQQNAWDIGAYEYTDSALEIITSTLASTQIGKAVSYPVVATGGTTPYAWSWSSSTTLPDGLSLNTATGIISGTPTVVGDYDFTLMVQDSVQANDSQGLSLTVAVATLSSAPGSLTAMAVSSSQIDLAWIDNSSDEDGFVIEYSTDGGNDYSELDRVAANVTTYSDTELSVDSTYYYRVFAYNASGDSASSNSVNATTQSLNQNSVPTGIKLDNNDADSVVENTASGSVISVLSSIDADNADVHTYTLVAGAGDEDNAKFTLFESNLLLAFSPDYEKPVDLGDVVANNSYSIRLQTDDGDEGIYQQSFVITVTDIDENTIVDSVAPVITLIGNRYQEVILGTAYIDLGATAMDDVQGDLTRSIQTDTSAVDVTTVGIYEVTYRVSDGSNTTRARRIVEVKELGIVDTTPPVITLLGVNPQEITRGNAYIELGATVTDDVRGDLTPSIQTDASAVDTSTEGVYPVIYSVSDGTNSVEVIRIVKVVAVLDTTPPVITLKGNGSLTITLGNAYVELGAIANDNVDGDISATITIDVSALDITKTGSYTVTYNVSDKEGNVATQITRTVTVKAATTSASGLDGLLLGLGLMLLAFRFRRLGLKL